MTGFHTPARFTAGAAMAQRGPIGAFQLRLVDLVVALDVREFACFTAEGVVGRGPAVLLLLLLARTGSR
jgi:hypothetical protein